MTIFMLFHAVLPDGAALIRPTNRRSNKEFALPSDRVLLIALTGDPATAQNSSRQSPAW